MVIAPVVVDKLSVTDRAYLHVVDAVDALRHVGWKRPYAEIDAGIVRRDSVRDEVVRAYDEAGALGDRAFYEIRDVLGVGVAHERIAEEVRDTEDIRCDMVEDTVGGAFVHLEDRGVAFSLAGERAALNEARRYAGGDVGAELVVHYAQPAPGEDVYQHVGGGRLAVGAGDGDDGLRHLHVAHEAGAEAESQGAGEISRVAPYQTHERPGALCEPEHEQESELSHDNNSFRKGLCAGHIYYNGMAKRSDRAVGRRTCLWARPGHGTSPHSRSSRRRCRFHEDPGSPHT